MTTLISKIKKIETIKINIFNLENKLEKYMNVDISDEKTRKEMRKVLIKITNLETKLSNLLETI